MGTAAYEQSASSLFSITTPLGKDKLLLRGFRGSEGMSRLFRFELDLLSEDPNIDFTKIIGQKVTISVAQADGKARYFNGVISRFGQGAEEGGFATYHAEMVPALWVLTRSADCRIFQTKTIPDILKAVFTGLDVSFKLQGSYQPRDYCVQYRETSFNFASRLMEEYGIFYYFEHADGKHTLVLGDNESVNADCPGQSEFRFYIESTAVLDEDVIQSWQAEQELRTGKCTLTDYNFETPTTSLLSSANTLDAVGGNTKYETFDYPGEYLKKGDGDSLVKIRMQEEESVHLVYHGTSDARSMSSGFKFTLKEHYRDDMNTSYLLTEIEHSATTSYGTSRGALQDHYSNSFKCIPASVTFRPLRLTPRPTIMGPQPAVVVGPSGEEIYTDKYGRIKVQFFWDRQGKKDDKSSCWIRVSQIWAGKQWGVIFLPRIGQEVMVDFLEGDPDQPLVTGSVYNAEQMPPYTLPSDHTKSTIKTRSSKGGGSDNFNEIRFEDKKGSEEIFINAEKDMNVIVEHDETWKVGHDQTIEIKNDRTEKITDGNEKVDILKGTRTHTVKGDESLTVQSGKRTVEVQTGDDTHTIKQGNRNVTISQGNDSLKISMGDQTTKLDLGSISTEAMQSITLKVGQNSITIDQTGVTISGIKVSVSATATCSISASAMMDISADGMLSISGAMTSINS